VVEGGSEVWGGGVSFLSAGEGRASKRWGNWGSGCLTDWSVEGSGAGKIGWGVGRKDLVDET
jgi:hypothetical protein